jgi:hypothetical protein
MSDAVKDAQELFTEAMDFQREQRRQVEEDLKFTDPSNPDQWDSTIKAQREADPGGVRPCLVFDQLGQYISNVSGQIQQRPPALHALPVDGGADRKTAEQLDGFFRHIEHASKAQQHYSTGLLSSARVGVGYLVVRPEYTNRALNYQEPRISSIGDPLKVVFDPWAVELDGSDATFGFILQPLSPREFKRRYGEKAVQHSFGDDGTTTRDERESILTAEMWNSETRTENMVICVDLSKDPDDEFALTEAEFLERAQDVNSPIRPVIKDGVARTYKDKRTVVKWSRMSGAEVLDKETEYPASGIGIVPVYGYVGMQGGRLTYCGMGRRAMSAQRSYNYHMSEMHVFMGQAPKAPWIPAVAAIKGLEHLWDKASVESRAYLPWNHIDEFGNPIPKPERTQPGINLQNHIAGAQQALADIQAALGMYQANLGAPSNETSGVAIDSRKEQGEASTANFPQNLQASVARVGKLCMEMLPKLIDTKRQLRILGIDERPATITVDPQQETPIEQTESGLSINPNIGQYDVRVVVGASYTTQRTQAQQALNEVMARNPDMAPAVAPLWAQTLDIPYADKLAQALIAVAPPAVKAVLQPEGEQEGPTVAELTAKLEEMKAAMQEASSIAQEAEQDAAEANAKLADKTQENEVRQYEAETNRLKVTGANEEQIKAIVAELMNQMLTSPAPLGDEAPQGGDLQAAEEPIPTGEATELPPQPEGEQFQ